ncbi:MAG: 50S ribosomal protein L25 [Armatimonadota bacterium]|nr:MAG: 50S ribosomal protein L25 [Armatimonadota bacterium]
MARPVIQAEVRPELTKSAKKALRTAGIVPAAVYGSKVEGSILIQLKLADLTRAVKEGGENVIIDLEIQGNGSKSIPVMVHQVQRDPRSRRILHVDLRAISLDEKVTTTVPVHLEGEPVGVKQGGILDQLHSEITITALPQDIPPHITLDVSGMQVGDIIRLGDIKVEKAEVVGQADDAVVMVRQPHVGHVEAAAPAPEAAEEPAEESATEQAEETSEG